METTKRDDAATTGENMSISEFLDGCKNGVAVGSNLPSQYAEQLFIANVEGLITTAEFHKRMSEIPFSPIFLGLVPKAGANDHA
jgi:hypothetical protein